MNGRVYSANISQVSKILIEQYDFRAMKGNRRE
jgi:hypothetical protein